MSDLKFRKLEKKDFKNFITILNEFRTIENLTEQLFYQMYEKTFQNNFIFVIEYKKQIIATAKLLVDQKFFNNFALYGFIEDVIVTKKFRKQNIGTFFIKNIINFCKKKKFYKVTLTCKDKLTHFYQKNNFEIYDVHMSQLI